MKMANRHWARCERQQMIQILAIMTLLAQSVAGLHLPRAGFVGPTRGSSIQIDRRQDSDYEDDMDSNASAPYQNQNNNDNTNTDGYEENEPDGPYGETPREEEGQADLERFFDDHLGASERDGMDKENLPSNLVGYVALGPHGQPAAMRPVFIYDLAGVPAGPQLVGHPIVAQASKPIASYERSSRSQPSGGGGGDDDDDHRKQPNSVEMRYLRLPDDRVIVVHQEERDGRLERGRSRPRAAGGHHRQRAIPARTMAAAVALANAASSADSLRPDASSARDGEVIATENEDMDRVYVTNALDKPFKIGALGGYDPEEDFQDASRELLEEPSSTASPRGGAAAVAANDDDDGDDDGDGGRRRRRNSSSGSKARNLRGIGHRNQRERDSGQPTATTREQISFNDGDSDGDSMFNDASETDEVTFAQDDPYQTDLEAEMRSQAFDKPTRGAADNQPTSAGTNQHQQQQQQYQGPLAATAARSLARPASADDESEGAWINDGVDDMEVPSQSHQDTVLNKAAAAKQQQQASSTTAAIVDDANLDEAPDEGPAVAARAERRAAPQQEQPQGEGGGGGGGGNSDDDDDENSGNGSGNQIDPENQRMSNANYLKNHRWGPDDGDSASIDDDGDTDTDYGLQ